MIFHFSLLSLKVNQIWTKCIIYKTTQPRGKKWKTKVRLTPDPHCITIHYLLQEDEPDATARRSTSTWCRGGGGCCGRTRVAPTGNPHDIFGVGVLVLQKQFLVLRSIFVYDSFTLHLQQSVSYLANRLKNILKSGDKGSHRWRDPTEIAIFGFCTQNKIQIKIKFINCSTTRSYCIIQKAA